MNENRPESFRVYLPLIFAAVLITGIFIGSGFKLNKNFRITKSGGGAGKISELMEYISENYVDTVNAERMATSAINGLLTSLDPHSQYIPAEHFHEVIDPMTGNFEGIGVQFRLIRDTITVLRVIEGGPSEAAGLSAGDRIIRIDGRKVAGVKIGDQDVVKQLKGPRGTTVKIDIFRRGKTALIPFTIIRGVIPTFSLDAAYMVSDKTGYIKLERFASTTGDEFREALTKLLGQGMEKLIFDLRGNTGGYLEEAFTIADELIPEGMNIVYTEGRKRPKKVYTATGGGLFEQGELVVLIDEGSASASEILAGAVQDNDRGLVVGRRSFGKGLVQEQINLRDGSAIRLTVARYFTPSGRSIQRAYDKGNTEYNHELIERYRNGEMEHPDSIQFNDSLKYKTLKGRTVYGGGGIMPDVYVKLNPKDSGNAWYYSLANSTALEQLIYDYIDDHRSQLKRFKDIKSFTAGFMVPDELFQKAVYIKDHDSKRTDPAVIAREGGRLRNLIKALIARNVISDDAFYPIYNETDRTFLKAVELLSSS